MNWLGKIIIRLLGLDELLVGREEYAERLRDIYGEVNLARDHAWKAYSRQTKWDDAHDEYHRAQARSGDLDAEIEKLKQMKRHRERLEKAISGADPDHAQSPRSKSGSSSDPDDD